MQGRSEDVEKESFKLHIFIFEIHSQAAREIANTLARAPNVTYLPGGQEQNLLLGIGTR